MLQIPHKPVPLAILLEQLVLHAHQDVCQIKELAQQQQHIIVQLAQYLQDAQYARQATFLLVMPHAKLEHQL